MNTQGKYYLTKQGLKEIKNEYQNLLKARKINIKKEAPSLLHSEELNAKFVSFREDFEYLESRIEEIEHILNNYDLIKMPLKNDKAKVCLGAHVKVEVGGQEDEFMIIGTLEANPAAGKISDLSPVGKALLGHKVGEVVTINSPTKITYKIKQIKYKSS